MEAAPTHNPTKPGGPYSPRRLRRLPGGRRGVPAGLRHWCLGHGAAGHCQACPCRPSVCYHPPSLCAPHTQRTPRCGPRAFPAAVVPLLASRSKGLASLSPMDVSDSVLPPLPFVVPASCPCGTALPLGPLIPRPLFSISDSGTSPAGSALDGCVHVLPSVLCLYQRPPASPRLSCLPWPSRSIPGARVTGWPFLLHTLRPLLTHFPLSAGPPS